MSRGGLPLGWRKGGQPYAPGTYEINCNTESRAGVYPEYLLSNDTQSGNIAASLDAWDRYALAQRDRQRKQERERLARRKEAEKRFYQRADYTPPTPHEPTEDDRQRNERWLEVNRQWQREALERLKTTDPRRYYTETLTPPLDYVRAYPTLLAAAMRSGRVPEMRVYLLIKSLDPTGRGWVNVDDIRTYFTQKYSPYRVMGWRRLRQILTAGAGVFWTRDDRRVFLKSPAHIGAGLGVDRLAGSPVSLMVVYLLESQHETAAAFYSAWHAARGETPGPVSRVVIREKTGAAESTQRTYDHTADVKRFKNIVILGDATHENIETHAWQRGRGIFRLRDYLGKHGRPGWVHLAANMPASYVSPLATLPHGRQRKVNKSLRNLVYMGRGKECGDRPTRVYHDDGGAAGEAYNADGGQHDHYWRMGPTLKPTAATPPRLEGATVWGVVFKL